MAGFKDIYAKEAHAMLLREMRTGAYANCPHLPRESELAKVMGISRTQLRDILAVLECEGFITRRHGVGTIINRHVLQVKTRMDMEQEFLEMIHAGGFKPGASVLKVERGCATEAECAALQLPEGTEVIRCEKLCTADKNPALLCRDIFMASLLKGEVTEQMFQAPVFQVLQDKCGVNCYMDISELHPIVASNPVAEILNLPLGTPLMYIDEVDYDIEGKPVLYSQQYFVNDYFHYNILRKRL